MENAVEPELLQITSLPFGLSSAPVTFAMISNWIAQVFRNRGMRVIVYLDDFLIVNQKKHVLADQAAEAVRILSTLGWTVNFKKSVLIPTQVLEYLGVTWDLSRNLKLFPVEKRLRTQSKIKRIMILNQWNLKDAQSMLGTLNFASFAIPRGRLHCRPLQMACARLPKDRPYAKCALDQAVLEEFHWWLKALSASTPIHCAPIAHFLTTDASGTGWGAVIDGIRLTSGIWNPDQKLWHSNLKEMWAIIFSIHTNIHRLRKSSVLVQSDNKSVVSYIRNEGGLRSKALFLMTRTLFQIVDENEIHLVPYYLPGQYNVEADTLSRQKAEAEWTLTPEACQVIFRRYGTPQIDLFASKRAHLLPRQSSWKLTTAGNDTICPVFWIRKLIEVSARRRGTDLTDLFITARGGVRAASRTVLGGWVKSLLREAGVSASAGSTRSAAASFNWLDNCPIDELACHQAITNTSHSIGLE
ncbi:uncharacterized protein LOC126382290 [Pectinophora gossypiella]|uniref:uncharacterized protein LOC126382290 n=1 Tax=Pectinophora gossypiella TaxID=13191 RepID=UPI00214EA13A|nr:uncharacterized protein LOC126382290 [Pectinophora gossypiella]